MNALRLLVAGVMVVALTAGVRAEKKEEKKDNAKLLLGSWEATKAAEGTLPVGAVVTFEKDGKFKTVGKVDGKEETHGGTYTVDGDKFTLTMKQGDNVMKLTITIKKISDTELVTASDDGKVVEFKRKK
jgi:uncharacterized protein (TIGR03066 family)